MNAPQKPGTSPRPAELEGLDSNYRDRMDENGTQIDGTASGFGAESNNEPKLTPREEDAVTHPRQRP